MSYILEALKKSQQERELGRVPTLDSPALMPDEPLVRPGYWGLAAVALAALAVVIALYAALRGVQPPAAEVVEVASVPATPTPEPPLDALLAEPVSGSETVAEAASAPSDPAPLLSPEPVAARPSPASERAEPASAVATSKDGPIEVPEDLRQEIEAFKEQVRQERGGGTKKAAAPAEVPPQKLRLPRDVAERMPAFLMTVHRYDADPAERFVLINARKTREGQETREGIRVEQILPDGAVLSYDGNRFFQRR